MKSENLPFLNFVWSVSHEDMLRVVSFDDHDYGFLIPSLGFNTVIIINLPTEEHLFTDYRYFS